MALATKLGVGTLAKQRILSAPVKKSLAKGTNDNQTIQASTDAASQMVFSPRPFNEMPGPKGLPMLGTLVDYMKPNGLRFNMMFQAFQERAREFGPVYRETIGNRLNVIVSDPYEYAKVIRIDGKTPHRFELVPMAHYRNKNGLCLGPVNAQGEEWYRYRNSLSKKMLRPREVVSYAVPMSGVVDDLISIMKNQLDHRGHVHDLEFLLFKWSFESVCYFLFDERLGSFASPPSRQAEEFVKNLVGFFQNMQRLMYMMPVYKVIPTPSWKKYEEHADNLHKLGLYFINKKLRSLESHKSQSNTDDKVSFLTYLLKEQQLPPEEAVSHTIDLMMGGVETTSNALMWTMYNLAIHPGAQKDLHTEIDEVVPADGTVTPDVLNSLSYTKACLKETFRLYPITFATSRVIKEDVEIGGYVVPAGTHVQANLFGMGRDPGLFAQPEIFQPERWMRDSETNIPSIQAFTNLPWGHGPRMCLGRRVAEQEIYIALSKIMKEFEVDYQEVEPVKPVLQTVMTPDRPVKLIFKPRAKSRSRDLTDVTFGMPHVSLSATAFK